MPKRPDEPEETRRSGGTPRDPDEQLYGAALPNGARVGDVEVLELRARGGFATVYRARHLTGGHAVGVKVLHEMLSASSTMVKRFELEADAVNRIRHPNIVE